MNQPDLSQFLNQPFGHEITAAKLGQEMLEQGHWQARYRWLMKLGSRMEKLNPALQQVQAEVAGCESKVWLYHQVNQNKHYFLVDSDSRIVRGLLILVMSSCHGKTTEQLAQLDLNSWFEQLGLLAHLSPSRSNGLYAVIEKILAYR